MNHNEDVAFNSLKLASKEESYSTKSGSLIVNGGIGCKKTIRSENIISECLLNENSAIFNNNVSIAKDLKVNVILPEEENDIANIGSFDNRYNDIYSNNMDTNNIYVNNISSTNTNKCNYLFVNNSAEIGKNDRDNVMLFVDYESNVISSNSDVFTIRNNNDNIFQIDDKSVWINSLLKYKFDKIDIHSKTYNLYPSSSIIIVSTCVPHCRIDLMLRKTILSADDVESGSFVKIYNKSCNNFSIIVNSYEVPINSFIEFILIESEWIALRNDGIDGEMDEPKSHLYNADPGYTSDSHDDCDSSSNFGNDDISVGYSPDSENVDIIRRLNNKEPCSKKVVEKKCVSSKKNTETENSLGDISSFEVYN